MGVSILVIVLENRMSPGRHSARNQTLLPGNTSGPCWETSEVAVVEPCAKCAPFDMKVKHEYCTKTGYKEHIECIYKNGAKKKVYRSCPKGHWVEEKNFWTFESVSLLFGLIFYSVVHIRRRRLDHILMEKVHRQIAAGV
ncbi:hypothetical protein LSAT2_007168 [Lamellibrachia satsuma]|nr:hypothetical protein LSAT2_007168 [Lamellibrachia satsuma]